MPNTSRPGLVLEKKLSNNLTLYLGFAVAVLFFILSGLNALRNTGALRSGMAQVERANTVITALDTVLSLMKDAETGQRGFLITGDENYLQPYHSSRTAISAEVTRLRDFSKQSVAQADVIPQVEAQIASKLAELEQTIELRRSGGFEAARAIVLTDRGKQTMDDLRQNLTVMKREEKRVKDLRMADMEAAHRLALTSAFATAALGIVLSFTVMWLMRRANLMRKWQDWSRTGRLELSAVMSGEKSMGPLAESILGFLSRYVDAHAGAVFADRGGSFERVALVGAPASNGIPERFNSGEGLLGRAVVERSSRRIDDVPESYLRVGSALGEGLPKHLLILPATADDSVNAVIELGFLTPLNARRQEFLQQVSEMVGVAMKAALYREHLQDLLEETQRQSEEVQAQSEELRVSNEELDEQSRALKETQVRLELQQT
ncbi:MAG: histidine kinase, partial [Verrucomicrobiaceae bacterium]